MTRLLFYAGKIRARSETMEEEEFLIRFEAGPVDGCDWMLCRNDIGWPPPATVEVNDIQYRLVSYSQIPDSVHAKMPHVLRGAVYRYFEAPAVSGDRMEDVEDGKPMTNGASFYTEDGI